MLANLKDTRIILGSNSPRRKALLASIGVEAEVIVRETDEQYDPSLSPTEIVHHIAMQKAKAFEADFKNELVITADTIVISTDGRIIGKPASKAEAVAELTKLSDASHLVMTAVVLLYKGAYTSFVETTEVKFFPLTAEEINYYIEEFKPYDKAGSYGIQEWIGMIGTEWIRGAFHTVVGLPTGRLYQILKTLTTT